MAPAQRRPLIDSSPRPAARRRTAGRVGALAALLWIAPAAPARQPADDPLWQRDPEALASWTFDPRPSGGVPDPATAADLIADVCAAAAACAASPGDALAHLPCALLDHDLSRTPPFSLKLSGVAAAPTAGGVAHLTSLIASACVLADLPWADVTAAVRRGAGASGPTDPAVEASEGTNTEGQQFFTIHKRDWPDWLDLTARRTGTGVMIDIGSGVRVLTTDRWPGEGSAWRMLNAELVTPPPTGPRVFELFVDLNAVRAAAGEAFLGTPANRYLGAWRIANARGVLVRGLWRAPEPGAAPGVVGVQAAWSARSEGPGVAHAAVLADPAWPRAAAGDGAGVEHGLVVRAEWTRWLAAALDTRGASLGGWNLMEFDSSRSRFLKDHGSALGRAAGALGERAVIAWRGPVTEVRAPLVAGTDAARLTRDLNELFSVAGRRVTFDAAARSWAFRLPLDPLIYGEGRGAFTVSVEGEGAGAAVVVRWGAMK